MRNGAEGVEREGPRRRRRGDLELVGGLGMERGSGGRKGGQTYGHTPRYGAGCLIYFCPSLVKFHLFSVLLPKSNQNLDNWVTSAKKILQFQSPKYDHE